MNSLRVAAIAAAVVLSISVNGSKGSILNGAGDKNVLSPSTSSASQHGWSALGYKGPLAGVPEVRGDGTLADTPEVVAARAAHLAALQAAIATNPDNDDGHYDPRKYGDDRYGVVSHVKDLTNTIAHYNSLASRHHSSGTVSAVAQEAAAKAQAQASAQAEAELALWKAKNAAASAASAIAQEAAANAEKQARAQAQAQASAKAEAELALWKAKNAAASAASAIAQEAAANAQKEARAHAKSQASAKAEAELALWKAENAAAAAAIATGGYSYGVPAQQNQPYFGPLAMLQVLPSGYLADTQEVAAARNIHLSALAEAQASAALWRAKYTQAQHRPWN